MDLKISNLSFRYGSHKPFVLNDISFSFPQGGVCGLLGPNGAGKSTLLYLIAGLLTRTSGSVTFDYLSTQLRLPAVLAQIYLVPEEPVLPRKSLDEYVRFYSVFYPQFNNENLMDAIKESDMFQPKRLDSLSMGQKKKIVLSFAIATSTPILLMDEPTNGLGIPGKAAFRRLVARYAADNKLFLISTHQVRDLDQLLDRILIMNLNNIIINESAFDLQKFFSFKRNLQKVPEDAICTLPALGGFDAMMRNVDLDESDINVELLFEAAMKHPETIKSIINDYQ